MEQYQLISELSNKCYDYLVNKELDKAEEVCNEILEQDPDYAYAHQNRVYIRRMKLQFKEALDLANELLIKYPKETSILLEKAYVYYDQKLYKEALIVFDEILAIDPIHEKALKYKITSLRFTGLYKEAEITIQNAIKHYPHNVGILLEKAWYYYDIKNYVDAINTFDQVLAIDKDNLSAKKWKIASLRRNDDFKAAQEEIDKALAKNPEYIDILLELGWLHYDKQNYSDAIAVFEQILSIDSSNFSAKQWKIASLRKNAQYDEAKKEIDETLAIYPDNLDVLYELGWLHYNQADYEKAIDVFNKILVIDENNAITKQWIIASLRKNKQFEEAKQEIDKALITTPHNVDILNELAWMYYDTNEMQQSIDVFDKVLLIDSKNISALLWKSVALRKLRRFNEAKEVIEEALAVAPSNVEAINELGWYYYDIKDYQKSQEVFKESLEISPYNVNAAKWRIICLRLLRHFDEASELISDSLKVFPENINFHIQDANINLDTHNFEKAISKFNKVKELDDTHEEVFIGLISCYHQLRDKEKAELIIKEAQEKLPNNSRVLYQVYWYSNEQGDYEKANESLKKAIKVEPDWIQLYVNRAEILNKLNRNYEAVQLIEYIQKTYPSDLDMHEGVGWYYLGRNQALKARKEFEYILSKQPNHIFGINGIGGSYFYQGLYNKSEDYFRQVIELDKENSVFHNNLAWALLRQNDDNKLDEAQKHANIALELDPNYDSAIGCLGVIAFKKRNLLESEDYFLRSIQVSQSRGSYTDLGALYAQTGRYDEAEKSLQKAIQFNRNDERAYIELGNLYLRQEKVKDAIKQFQFSKAIAPRNNETHNALAIALNQDGNFKEAEETLRSAIRQLDTYKRAPLHLTLSSILVNMGDKLEDKQLYEEALQETNKAKKIKTNNADAYFHSGIARFKLEDYSGSVKDFKECLKLDNTNFEAERNIRRLQKLVQSERIRSRGSMLAGVVVGTISIIQIIILWVFYFLGKINENILLVMLPILLGLTVVAFLLPWLIKIKLPGIEAELSQPTKAISSGPTGEINFGSSTSLINAGPQ